LVPTRADGPVPATARQPAPEVSAPRVAAAPPVCWPPPYPIAVSGPVRRPGSPAILGSTPVPSDDERAQYNHFVVRFVDPRNTLDLKANRTRLMILKQPPRRVQMGDEGIATYNLLSPTEVSITGRQVGTTIFNLWFPDPKDPKKDVILSYLVRVRP
jgi:Flp pilus assembly secretin CpaC